MLNDRFYLGLAHYVATASKDPSTQTGAVVVRPNRTFASAGFNGFPMGCDDDPALYADRDEKLGRVVHAELNAILTAREPLHGYTLYSTFAPCDRCAACIIQAGIKRVVAPITPPDKEERWGPMLKRARRLFKEAGVRCEEIPYADD
jgi:dCMP deaminase